MTPARHALREPDEKIGDVKQLVAEAKKSMDLVMVRSARKLEETAGVAKHRQQVEFQVRQELHSTGGTAA